MLIYLITTGLIVYVIMQNKEYTRKIKELEKVIEKNDKSNILLAQTLNGLQGALKDIITAVKLQAKRIEKFPSPEELAKQVLKVKIPVEEVPPDVMEAYNRLLKEGF